MRREPVRVAEDLLIELYRQGKREGKPVNVLVEELLRNGLQQKRQKKVAIPEANRG